MPMAIGVHWDQECPAPSLCPPHTSVKRAQQRRVPSRELSPLLLYAAQIPGTTSALVRNWKRPSDQLDSQDPGLCLEPQPRARAFLAEVKQMRARRKTAKMLMVVLLVFALCYLPISVLNVLKR